MFHLLQEYYINLEEGSVCVLKLAISLVSLQYCLPELVLCSGAIERASGT